MPTYPLLVSAGPTSTWPWKKWTTACWKKKRTLKSVPKKFLPLKNRSNLKWKLPLMNWLCRVKKFKAMFWLFLPPPSKIYLMNWAKPSWLLNMTRPICPAFPIKTIFKNPKNLRYLSMWKLRKNWKKKLNFSSKPPVRKTCGVNLLCTWRWKAFILLRPMKSNRKFVSCSRVKALNTWTWWKIWPANIKSWKTRLTKPTAT